MTGSGSLRLQISLLAAEKTVVLGQTGHAVDHLRDKSAAIADREVLRASRHVANWHDDVYTDAIQLSIDEAILVLRNLSLPQTLAVVLIFTEGRDMVPLFRSQSPIRTGSGMNGEHSRIVSLHFVQHHISSRLPDIHRRTFRMRRRTLG
jgi:hypothetical protein